MLLLLFSLVSFRYCCLSISASFIYLFVNLLSRYLLIPCLYNYASLLFLDICLPPSLSIFFPIVSLEKKNKHGVKCQSIPPCSPQIYEECNKS